LSNASGSLSLEFWNKPSTLENNPSIILIAYQMAVLSIGGNLALQQLND